MNRVRSLFRGELGFLEPDGVSTGIFKMPVETANIDVNGIIGDVQADKRFHGGPEKALHQFAVSSYKKIVVQFPDLRDNAVVGSLGENISSDSLDDTAVLIGDIYKFGGVLIQVSQPRRPCWKINHKFDDDRLAKFIAQQHITGWYYRVLAPGVVNVGDSIELVNRYRQSICVAELTQISLAHRPEIDALKRAMECPGLNQQWKNTLRDRIEFLDKLK